MKIEVKNLKETSILGTEAVILGVEQESAHLSPLAQIANKELGGKIDAIVKKQAWRTEFGKITVFNADSVLVILIGIGKKNEMSTDKCRALAATGIREAIKNRVKDVSLSLCENESIQAITEGILLGSYKFLSYKSKNDELHPIEKVVITASEEKIESSLAEMGIAKIISQNVIIARNMVNHPSNHMTPSMFAAEACRLVENTNLKISVLGEKDIEKLGMQAFLAVAKGSCESPQLLVIEYNGNAESQEKLGLIGKGICFDSGGISLKPADGMEKMKGDMAGAAAVLGAMLAIAQLKLAINVVAVIPCAENMPSGTAVKPGDVVRAMSGKTIEIVNTDAEGRLILADGIYYAGQLGATSMVDIATLTGACVIALGNCVSAIMGNDNELCDKLLAASKKTGEKMWRLPFYDDYKEQIKSDIADIKNVGGRPAGSITAGLFLAEFANEVPWVHIDIAGTSMVEKDSGYQVKGATGVGVRTLLALAMEMENK